MIIKLLAESIDHADVLWSYLSIEQATIESFISFMDS
jgi:hypothetical protein